MHNCVCVRRFLPRIEENRAGERHSEEEGKKDEHMVLEVEIEAAQATVKAAMAFLLSLENYVRVRERVWKERLR